jgi:protocatechuate 3,4-dioxygenase beta subunit
VAIQGGGAGLLAVTWGQNPSLQEQWRTFRFVSPTFWPLSDGSSFVLDVCNSDWAASGLHLRAESTLVASSSQKSGGVQTGIAIALGVLTGGLGLALLPQGSHDAAIEVGGPGTLVVVDDGSNDLAANAPSVLLAERSFVIVKNGGGRINSGDQVSIRIDDTMGNFFFCRLDSGGLIFGDGSAPFQTNTTFIVEFNEVRTGIGWRPDSPNCQSCATVTGKVTDDQGVPIQGATVFATGAFGNVPFVFFATTDNNGNYTLADSEGRGTCVPTGNIPIRATESHHQTSTVTLMVPNSGSVTQNFKLQCTVVSGQVVDMNSFPVPGAVVTVSGGGEMKSQVGDSNGIFSISCVKQGSITVSTAGDRSFPPSPFSIDDKGKTYVLLVVQTNCADIEGHVTDTAGNPIQGVLVTVFNSSLQATTDANGHYFISCVPPGFQYLEAFPPGSIPIVWNTGVSTSFMQLAGGTADPHWQVSGPGINGWQPATVVTEQHPFGTYFATSDSVWIGRDSGASADLGPPGYVYRQLFALGAYSYGFSPVMVPQSGLVTLNIQLQPASVATVSICGSWGVDNSGEIFLNGASTGITLVGVDPNNYNQTNRFEITSGFQVGTNSLEIHVVDQGNPSGLNVTDLSIGTIPCSARNLVRRQVQLRPKVRPAPRVPKDSAREKRAKREPDPPKA